MTIDARIRRIRHIAAARELAAEHERSSRPGLVARARNLVAGHPGGPVVVIEVVRPSAVREAYTAPERLRDFGLSDVEVTPES